jgi:hypothetical protein
MLAVVMLQCRSIALLLLLLLLLVARGQSQRCPKVAGLVGEGAPHSICLGA